MRRIPTQMTTTVSGVTVSQYAYTYNAQDLRDSEVAGDPSPGYADYLANYAYNNVNEITQLTDPGDKTPAYDAAGNLTGGYTPAGFAFTGAYDGSNRLLTHTYTDGGGAVNLSEYHYLGQMLTKKKTYRNGAVTQERRYVYDGDKLVQERDASNNLVNEYTHGLGLPGGIGGLLRLQQGGISGAKYSYLFDGKGNVTALLNGSTGQVAQTYQYDPFGQRLSATGSITQPMQFSTKPYDDQTGLSYYGYRFYAPALGRWLTRDPIGEMGGINLYGFVDNNPVNFIDPDGRNPAAIVIDNLLVYGPPAIAVTYTLLQQMMKKGKPPSKDRGDWDAEKGAEEWGRRNDRDPDECRRKFHDTKKDTKGSNPKEKYTVNPATGDIKDSGGNVVGNLGE